MPDLLAVYPFIYETDVIWGDMDAFQHVNNVVYFRYFESARTGYFKDTEVIEKMKQTGIGPIVHSQNCRYRYPLRYPDRIRTGVTVAGVGKDRFLMRYAIHSEANQVIAATGETLIVMFDYRNNRKAIISQWLLDKLVAVEGWQPDDIPPLAAEHSQLI